MRLIITITVKNVIVTITITPGRVCRELRPVRCDPGSWGVETLQYTTLVLISFQD